MIHRDSAHVETIKCHRACVTSLGPGGCRVSALLQLSVATSTGFSHKVRGTVSQSEARRGSKRSTSAVLQVILHQLQAMFHALEKACWKPRYVVVGKEIMRVEGLPAQDY